jgi:hypothetical protein
MTTPAPVIGRASHAHDRHVECPVCGELVPPHTLDVHHTLAHPKEPKP